MLYTQGQEILLRQLIVETIKEPLTAKELEQESGITLTQLEVSKMYVSYKKQLELDLPLNFLQNV